MSADELLLHIAARLPRYRELVSKTTQTEEGIEAMRDRPTDNVWSAVEYLAHMRDVASFFGDRINRVLTEHRPLLHVGARFAELAELRSYRNEDPAEVLAQFEERASVVQGVLTGLDHGQWARVGLGSEGNVRTTLMLASRFAHEVHHHLLDLEEQLGPNVSQVKDRRHVSGPAEF